MSNVTLTSPSHDLGLTPVAKVIPRITCICNGDHWFVWCNLAWEHYNVAVNFPLPFILPTCTRSPGVRWARLKVRPRDLGHLLAWESYALLYKGSRFTESHH